MLNMLGAFPFLDVGTVHIYELESGWAQYAFKTKTIKWTLVVLIS